jgi:hypothetical protein
MLYPLPQTRFVIGTSENGLKKPGNISGIFIMDIQDIVGNIFASDYPVLFAKGSCARKHALVLESEIEGISALESLIRDPPKKFPNPTPNVVIARPVTF